MGWGVILLYFSLFLFLFLGGKIQVKNFLLFFPPFLHVNINTIPLPIKTASSLVSN